jgi:hypothetical protein
LKPDEIAMHTGCAGVVHGKNMTLIAVNVDLFGSCA